MATSSRSSASIVSAECGGPSTRSAKANEPGAASLSALSVELRAEARVDLVAPAHVDGAAGLAAARAARPRLAHDGRELPVRSPSVELEQRRAVAPGAQLAARARAGPGRAPVRR